MFILAKEQQILKDAVLLIDRFIEKLLKLFIQIYTIMIKFTSHIKSLLSSIIVQLLKTIF